MIWERGKYFLLPWLLFFVAGIIAILAFGKHDLHVILNARQPRSADSFFKTITLLGEGLAIGLAMLYMLFKSRHGAGFLVTSWLFTFLLVQLFKQIIFDGSPRPASVFKNSEAIYFIEGVSNRMLNSFPSGHTAEIFSVCFGLALLSHKPRYGIYLFIPAFLVAYSRVYLSQHFMEDILAGSIIALLCTSICYYIWWRNSAAFRKYTDRF